LAADGALIVLANLRATPRAGGRVVLTRKFMIGMEEYASLWGGPVETVMEPDPVLSPNLDNVEVDESSLGFRVHVLPFDSPKLREVLRGSAVILAGISDQLTHLAALGRELGIPVVFGSEYTLRTRIQVARAETPNPLRFARRALWEWSLERRQREAIRASQGLQCNGTPTMDAYRALSPDPMLFFDTRTRRELMLGEDALERRLAELRSGRRLRLIFSGRLNAMKGAPHLIGIARELLALGCDFELAICGGGPLEGELARDIERHGLGERVTLRGVLDFETELVPFVSQQTDLFVCCHVQGDPACTYLETFACGVPIAGYANEALAGLLDLTPSGVAVPIGDHKALARAIRDLDADRERLASLSRQALAFARVRDFEAEFQRRIEHLRGVAERGVR
jgi:colanic acid/amylovoran biosynthesis glycosyltransferase